MLQDKKMKSELCRLLIISLLLIICAVVIKLHIGNPDKSFSEFNKASSFNYFSALEQSVVIVDGNQISVGSIAENSCTIDDKWSTTESPSDACISSKYVYLAFEEYEEKYTKIIQYSYHGELIKEVTLNGLYTLSFKKDVLFLKNDSSLMREEGKGVLDLVCANKYILESNFGNDVTDVSKKNDKDIIVSDIHLYWNEDLNCYVESQYKSNSFFTRSFLPLTSNQFGLSAEDYDIGITEVINYIQSEYGNAEYYINEYQKGNYIYEVCDVSDTVWTPQIYEKGRKIRNSFVYKINLTTNKLEILFSQKGVVSLFCTDDIYVYKKDDYILKRDLRSDSFENIYHFQYNDDNNVLIFDFKNILIYDNDRNSYEFIRINS